MPLLDPQALQQAASSLPLWSVHAEALQRSFLFTDFVAAMHFVNTIAALAEQQGHHPDIDIRYNQVHLRISSHDSGGTTERDLRLAHAIDALA